MALNRWTPGSGRIGEWSYAALTAFAGVAGSDALEPAGDGR